VRVMGAPFHARGDEGGMVRVESVDDPTVISEGAGGGIAKGVATRLGSPSHMISHQHT
jgi:hypothetical protein